MRIVRFSPNTSAGIGSDPLFGVLNAENQILVLRGDPIYSGIVPTETKVSLDEVRLLAPVIPRSKVVCVGKNYADHAAEMGSEVPKEPVIFLKPNTSVIGPDDLIQWPRMSERVDFEGELAVVISRICKDVPREKVSDVIFGYTIANDVTARDLQKIDGQWSRAKGFDTFCPLGPWIETEFEPGSQQIKTTLDGEIKQSDVLTSMTFKIPEIVEFISSVMTLLPGDVILTGTPAGIGPMPPGAEVVITIEGIGSLSNKVSPRAK
ncbi:MAG: fumarylacetoacetate hydrolase family protein [Actinomycetota bacterium]|jgi:2-keto-4-pentenoate hydratase/2-oxohepta-3-ene-1,7-dioic acid hydratase in catechol pathway|tara:strand:+ start:6062 stop:6853 length:792 start_codon:yes stop_codon:yes gene_type:complete